MTTGCVSKRRWSGFGRPFFPGFLGVDADDWADAGLRAVTAANLDTYWRDQAAGLAKFPDEAAGDLACEWCVLGVARLHHLVDAGHLGAETAVIRRGARPAHLLEGQAALGAVDEADLGRAIDPDCFAALQSALEPGAGCAPRTGELLREPAVARRGERAKRLGLVGLGRHRRRHLRRAPGAHEIFTEF